MYVRTYIHTHTAFYLGFVIKQSRLLLLIHIYTDILIHIRIILSKRGQENAEKIGLKVWKDGSIDQSDWSDKFKELV